jgi:hypothetical protein
VKITLGESRVRLTRESPPWRGVDQAWPVLRDLYDTGAYVLETECGYRFEVPHGAMSDEVTHQGKEQPFRELAREDAEKWFNDREKIK